MRIAWTLKKRAAELRRGCAEKSETGFSKMAAQTLASRIQMPACARTAVPGRC